jgi:nucleotide-binding universal stress UspA family protein
MTNLIASPEAPSLLTAKPENPVQRGPIVLALHGSEPGKASIVLAHRLAERLHVGLEVITVGEALAVPPGIGMTPVPITYEHFAPVQEDIVRAKVRDVCGEDWHLAIRYGIPAREIPRLAQEVNATLIVVGAAPHRGLRHQVSGVRAMQVLRRATCPVLSIAPDADALPRTVVAAIDFSPASIRAAEAGVLLLDDGGKFILAHARLPVELSHPIQDHAGALFGVDVGEVFTRLREELRPYLPTGATLETRQLSGKVGSALLDLANIEKADLITVGRHSRNVVERFFVGSVATEVMHGAGCSVLGSPEPSAAETMRLKLRMTDSAVTKEASDWAEVLDAVSERNAGRDVTLEENDPALGSQVRASGFVLTGIDYDAVTRRVEVMLGRGGGRTDHLTRSIDEVSAIGIKSDSSGRDQAIEIVHGKTLTLLYFET